MRSSTRTRGINMCASYYNDSMRRLVRMKLIRTEDI